MLNPAKDFKEHMWPGEVDHPGAGPHGEAFQGKNCEFMARQRAPGRRDEERKPLMEDLSRRSLLTIIAGTAITPALAQHVHEAVAQMNTLSGGASYKPLHFSQHYFSTLRQMADMIIPADEHSAGASVDGAAEFIDMFCSRNQELAATFDGGLTWLDQTMHERYGSDFVTAKPAQQTALLGARSYTANITPETAHGVPFWTLPRNMVVDAFYTSPAGVKDLGYMGNKAVGKFEVPQEAVDYVMKRSPLA